MQKVTTYYLEMDSKNKFIAKTGFNSKIEIKEIDNDAYLNFIFFAGVGLPFKWYSRLKWSIDEWQKYFTKKHCKNVYWFFR